MQQTWGWFGPNDAIAIANLLPAAVHWVFNAHDHLTRLAELSGAEVALSHPAQSIAL